MQLGSTAIGIKTKEGVVLAVEKRITSPLLVFDPFFTVVIQIGNLLHLLYEALYLKLIYL